LDYEVKRLAEYKDLKKESEKKKIFFGK